MTRKILPFGQVIAIDPGHGGEDRGGIGAAGYIEADCTLDVACRLSRLLGQRGLEVVLTRSGDQTVSIGVRKETARRQRPVLCISLHTASYPWNYQVGSAAWYSVERFLSSRRLARWLVQSVGRATGRPSRGALFCVPWGNSLDGYEILVGTGVPTVVMELGCHTSGEDELLLQSERFRHCCAVGLFSGILRFLNLDAGECTSLALLSSEPTRQEQMPAGTVWSPDKPTVIPPATVLPDEGEVSDAPETPVALAIVAVSETSCRDLVPVREELAVVPVMPATPADQPSPSLKPQSLRSPFFVNHQQGKGSKN